MTKYSGPNAAPSSGETEHPIRLWWLLFWSGMLIYTIAFYGWTNERWLGFRVRLSWLLVPEAPLLEWVGGDWSRFQLLDRVPIFLIAGGMLSVAFLLGVSLIHQLGAAAGLSRLELSILGIATGLGLLSTFVLVVGLAGLLRARWVYGVAAVVVIGGAYLSRAGFLVFRKLPATADPRDRLARLSAWLCLPFATVILLGGALPPWHFDVREYHAQVPKEWYQQGQVDFLPHNVYGNMPLGAEILSVAAMNAPWSEEAWWWGTIVGKTLIAAFALLTALSIYAFCQRHFSPAAGAIGAYLFLSTPWISFVSMSGLIEGASAFYSVATLQAIMIWNPADATTARGRLVLAGFLAGSAVACKYPALLFVAGPATLLVAGRMYLARKVSYGLLVSFFLAMLLGCGLWLAKNAALTHNPTYPLLYELFDGKTRTEAKNDQWNRAHRAPEGGFSLQALRNSAVTLLISSEHTSPLLVPFVLLAVCCRRRKMVLLLAGLVAFAVTAWWLLTHRLDRFLLPHLPFVAVLGAIGATHCHQRNWRRGVAVILCFGLLVNLPYVASRSVADNRFLVSLDSLRRISLNDLNDYNPHIAPAHLFLNENVAPGFTAVFCGEAQVFNLRVPVRYNTCFDDCVLEQILRDKTRAERRAAFRELRISHVLVDWHELDRYRSPGNYGYSGYVTRALIRDELVTEQQLLVPVSLPESRESSEIFEVVGWRAWATESTE